MGIMTSYGSYNAIRKPVILDNIIICVGNCGLSFVAGFAIWSVVGYLQFQNNLAKTKTSSIGLAFIAYPTAIDSMDGSNAWCVVLGLTLFLLGIDSAFSMVEATSTVICDTPTGRKIPRTLVAFVLCCLGFLLSVPFCTNWGFFLFDVVDHYLCIYLLLLIGILQCLGVGWGFDAADTAAKSKTHQQSLMILTLSYWALSLYTAGVCVVNEDVGGGVWAWLFRVFCFSLFPSLVVAYPSMGFWGWYNDICMCGVKKIGYSFTSLGRYDVRIRGTTEPLFVFYWGVLIKYLIPFVLMVILISSTKGDIENPYGGYATHW